MPHDDRLDKRIQVLPETVANQIAAGEVVERPVAVVKELVENSLDAGASRIEIGFHYGGKRYIRVEDNGCGIPATEVHTALQRHGTSKIRVAEDLNYVTSLGFRGEALPAIAAVSQLTLRTRTAASDQGIEVVVDGGKIRCERACGMPQGTLIEVQQLFKTLPARRKFLKTDNTEGAHIIHLTRLLAAAQTETAFILLERGRTLFKLPRSQGLKERIAAIFGSAFAHQLIPLKAGGDRGLLLEGFIGKPGVGRATTQSIAAFINRRPVISRTLNYALIEACHTYIPKGRYPVAFLFLTMPPEDVDVNVHPTKREVRFRQEGAVRQFIIQSVLDCLRAATATPEVQARLVTLEHSRTAPASPPSPTSVSVSSKAPSTPLNVVQAPAMAPHVDSSSARSTPPGAERPSACSIPGEPDSSPQAITPWRWLGLLNKTYAVFASDTGLIVLHQGHARERVLFEQIKDQLERASPVSQPLLFPIAVELDPRTMATLEDHRAFLESMGFVIEPFGRGLVRLQALPDWLEAGEGATFIQDLLDRIRERGLHPEQSNECHGAIARMAARRAAGLALASEETALRQLVDRLLHCENALTDPQGRPTFFELNFGELNRRL